MQSGRPNYVKTPGDPHADDAIQAQLKAYLERLQRPIELVASLDDSANSQQMHPC